MATTLAERLQVKGERRLAVIGAPTGLPDIAGGRRADPAKAEVVLAFVADRAAFDAAMPGLVEGTLADAILWIAYPKLSGRLAGDLHRDTLREAVQRLGLDTVAQIAVDEDWSALRVKRV